jgi:hypothetical protein
MRRADRIEKCRLPVLSLMIAVPPAWFILIVEEGQGIHIISGPLSAL